jgi:hypothetical protein
VSYRLIDNSIISPMLPSQIRLVDFGPAVIGSAPVLILIAESSLATGLIG